jgi:hypothetical protein
MTPGERCDEILRLIDEILDETRNGAPAPIRSSAGSRARRTATAAASPG